MGFANSSGPVFADSFVDRQTTERRTYLQRRCKRRRVFDAFRLAVALDRNAGQIRVKALISSAFTKPATFGTCSLTGHCGGQGLTLRPPGYEPPRLCTRVPPYSAEMQSGSRIRPRPLHLGGTRSHHCGSAMLAERLQREPIPTLAGHHLHGKGRRFESIRGLPQIRLLRLGSTCRLLHVRQATRRARTRTQGEPSGVQKTTSDR